MSAAVEAAQIGGALVLAGLGIAIAKTRLRWRRDTRPLRPSTGQAAAGSSESRPAPTSTALARATSPEPKAPAPAPTPRTISIHIGHVDQFVASGGQGAYFRAGVPLEEPAAQAARVVNIRPDRSAKALEGPK